MMIYGTEYHRRKARMSLRELSELSGVSIADLLRVHSESELEAGNHTAYPSRTDGRQNCVAVYRRVKGLTLEQLAQRLGSSNRQCAQLACSGEKAGRKHVRLLAAYEGISPEQFRQKYAPNKEAA